MDWNKMRTFYFTAKAGSFTAAALDLRLNQSSISRQVMLLEKSLNYPLLNRQLHNLHLTEAGEVLFAAVENMLKQVKMAQIAVADMNEKPEGLLTIGTSTGICSRFLTSHLGAFCAEHPNLRLRILTGEDTEKFASQDAEALIIPLQSIPEGYSGDYLTTIKFALFASPEYVQNHGQPTQPEGLDEHRLVAYGGGDHLYPQAEWFLDLARCEKEARVSNIEVNSRAGILKVVKQGVGIAALEQHIGIAEGLTPILPEIKGPEVDLYFAYPYFLKDSAKVRVMRNLLQKVGQLDTEDVNCVAAFKLLARKLA